MSLKTETLATNMCNVSKQKGLHEIFFSMAEKIPEHIAVIWYENTRKEISYVILEQYFLLNNLKRIRN